MLSIEEQHIRKLSILNQETWSHHRSGWGFVLSNLYYTLHINNGIEFIGYLDGHFTKNDIIFNKEWIGVLHNPPHLPDHIKERHPKLHSLSTFFKSDNWYKNKSKCLGLITLSEYCAKYIANFYTNILTLHHPTDKSDVKFDIDSFLSSKRIISIGHWLRNFSFFNNLKHTNKILIKPFTRLIVDNTNVKILEHLDNETYDLYLSSSVVFLNLYDSSANNVIVECIERNTPIIINRLPAVEEYLGTDYPLYYNTIEEANHLVNDNEKIVSATSYLSRLNKNRYDIKYFINGLSNSELYRRL